MTAKHTPGPWSACVLDAPLSDIPAYVERAIARSGGDEFYFVLGTDGSEEVDVAHVGNGPRRVANSRLIAAAPDLLALAHRYASECGECRGTGVTLVATCDQSADFGRVPQRVQCPACADIWAVIDKAEAP